MASPTAKATSWAAHPMLSPSKDTALPTFSMHAALSVTVQLSSCVGKVCSSIERLTSVSIALAERDVNLCKVKCKVYHPQGQ
jgi:hypothetical protein